MRHAGAAALHGLSELLQQIRVKDGIKEKKPGIFYRQSKSFLHFHEDPAGRFADLRMDADFDRYPVNTKKEWKVLLTAIDRARAGASQLLDDGLRKNDPKVIAKANQKGSSKQRRSGVRLDDERAVASSGGRH